MKFIPKMIYRIEFWLTLFLLCVLPTQVFAASASITLNKSTANVNVGSTLNLKATVTGKSSEVTWKSSNTSVATVNSNGKVTGKQAGKATITAKANGKTAKCVVTVKKGEDYKTLYKAFLEQGIVRNGNNTIPLTDAIWYYVLNIDKKGVPELILCSPTPMLSFYWVYTIKNGKMVLLSQFRSRYKDYAKPYVRYVSKYKGIVSAGSVNHINGYWTWTDLYTVSGKKLKRSYHAEEECNPKREYYIGQTNKQKKKVSKAVYTSFIKKNLTGKKYTMLQNTAVNREKSFG